MALSLKRVVNNSQINDALPESSQKNRPMKKRPWQGIAHLTSTPIENTLARKEKYLLKFFRGSQKNTTKEFLLELIH